MKKIKQNPHKKDLCPKVVPNVNILCSARKLGSILDGSQCLEKDCKGLRRIQNVDATTHGGCAVFELICNTCETADSFLSGTRYLAVEGDERTTRYAEATLLMIGTIFGGGGLTSYKEICSAVGLSGFVSRSNQYYEYHFYHAAETLVKESLHECHKISDMQLKHGFGEIIGLFDGAWLHRGHGSQHGSAAIVDVGLGCIMWLGHCSKDESKYGRKAHKESSGMMEVAILKDLIVEAKDDGATFSMIVADADAGINKVATDAGIPLARCCNHGGKNVGKRGIQLGINCACACPIKKNADGSDNKLKKRVHNKITIGIAKKVQAALCATTVICGSDSQRWLKQIPQIINHYYDEHLIYTCELDGDWEVWTVESKCEYHGLFIEDEFTLKWIAAFDDEGDCIGEDQESIQWKLASMSVSDIRKHCPYIPRQFAAVFDCPTMKAEWLEYLKNNILCDAEMFCTPAGAVRTNLVETV